MQTCAGRLLLQSVSLYEPCLVDSESLVLLVSSNLSGSSTFCFLTCKFPWALRGGTWWEHPFSNVTFHTVYTSQPLRPDQLVLQIDLQNRPLEIDLQICPPPLICKFLKFNSLFYLQSLGQSWAASLWMIYLFSEYVVGPWVFHNSCLISFLPWKPRLIVFASLLSCLQNIMLNFDLCTRVSFTVIFSMKCPP